MAQLRNTACALQLASTLWLTACYFAPSDPPETQSKDPPRCSCEAVPPPPLLKADRHGTVPRKGGTVRIRLFAEPPSLMPLLDPYPVVKAIVEHEVMETLVRTSDDGTQIRPGLAKQWTIDENYRLFTFTLNRAAKWHDGRDLSSADVKLTFDKILDPDGQIASRRRFSDVREVTVVDETTIFIELDRPNYRFLSDISDITILPAHIFDHASMVGHSGIRKPMGTGPYRFVRWAPGRVIELERNPDWRGEPPILDRIEYWIVQDNRVAMDLFRRGSLDIVPELAGYIEEEPGQRVVRYPIHRYEAWVYNTTRPIFSTAQIRKAIGMMIDADGIRCAIFKCRTEPLIHPWPLGITPTKSARRVRFDPEGADALLKKNGWVDRNGDGTRERGGIDFSFTLLRTDLDRDSMRIATVVQDGLFEEAIRMPIATVDFSTYLSRLNLRDFDAAHISLHGPPSLDPWTWFHSQAAEGGQNHGALDNAELDYLIDQLKATHLDSDRIDIKKSISLKLDELHPMTLFSKPFGTALLSPSIRGFTIRDGWVDETRLWRTDSASGIQP